MMSLNLPDILTNSSACTDCLYPDFCCQSRSPSFQPQIILNRAYYQGIKKVKTQMAGGFLFNLKALWPTSAQVCLVQDLLLINWLHLLDSRVQRWSAGSVLELGWRSECQYQVLFWNVPNIWWGLGGWKRHTRICIRSNGHFLIIMAHPKLKACRSLRFPGGGDFERLPWPPPPNDAMWTHWDSEPQMEEFWIRLEQSFLAAAPHSNGLR